MGERDIGDAGVMYGEWKKTEAERDRLREEVKAKDERIEILESQLKESREHTTDVKCKYQVARERGATNRVRAEKAEAERDLYQGCCTRAFDEWQKLHPEAKVWPDGAVQLVELLKAKDAQIEELYGRITGLEMSWAEEVQAKDAEIADVTSQRDLLQRSYDSCNEKAEARVKELEAGCAEAQDIIRRLYRDVFPTHTIKWPTYAPRMAKAMGLE